MPSIDALHPYSVSATPADEMMDPSNIITPELRQIEKPREEPPMPADRVGGGAATDIAPLVDSGGDKTACIYVARTKKGYAAITDSLGQVSLSVFDNTKPSAGWSVPTSLSSKFTSTPRFVHTAHAGPLLVGCSDAGILVVDVDARVYWNIGFPTGLTLPVQGFDATNRFSDRLAQFALIDANGGFYLNSFVSTDDGRLSAGDWAGWGGGFAGKPALFFSRSTCWVAGKYIGGRYPYMCYCWAYLSDPRNYGSWWSQGYLGSNNYALSPTFAKNSNAAPLESYNYLFTIFSPTTGQTVAYSQQTSPDGYPDKNYKERTLGHKITSEIKFADTNTNYAPMFFQADNGLLLQSVYVNKEDHLSEQFRIVSPSVKFFSVVAVPRDDLGRGAMDVYCFLKTPAGADQTAECGAFIYGPF